MARPRKPSQLKVIQGNPGKRPLNKREPKPAANKPYMPRELSDGGRRVWRRLAGKLHAAGLLADIDADALAMYCELHARWTEAERAIQANGLTVMTPNGYLVQSPYVSIANRALADMRALLREFGMTPASRSAISIERPQEESEFESFLRRRSIGG